MKKYINVKLIILGVLGLLLHSCTDNNIIDLDQNASDVKDVAQDIVSPFYVSIDWSKTQIIENNPGSGKVVLSLNEDTKSLTEGSVFAITDPNHPSIKVVTSVRKSGNSIELNTVEGDLTNIFANVEFELRYEDKNGRSSTSVVPTAIAIEDENGKLIWQDTKIGTLRPVEVSLFNGDGMEVFSQGNTKLWFSELNSNLLFSYCLKLNFGLRRETLKEDVGRMIKMYKSKMIKAEVSTTVGLNANMVLEGQTKKDISVSEGDEILWHRSLPSINVPPVLFTVMGVPVTISPKIDIIRGSDMEFHGEASFKAVARTYTDFTTNVKWDMSQEVPYSIENKYQPPTFSCEGTNVSGMAKAKMRLWYYPSIKFLVYNVLGPVVEIKPYLGFDVSAGLCQTIGGSSKDYIAYDFGTFFGIDTRADITAAVMGFELEDGGFFKSEFKNMLEKDLMRSPTNILFDSALPNEVVANRTMVVNFEVKNQVLGFPVKCANPVFVKFSGNGTLAQQYVLTEDGRASAIWTPSSNDDTLTAAIYDGSGKVIDYFVYNGSKKVGTHLTKIGELATISYDELSRVSRYVNEDFDCKFQYNNDGLESIMLIEDGWDQTILTNLKFNQDGYLVTFNQLDNDGLFGTFNVTYNEENQPVSLTYSDNEGDSTSSSWEWEEGRLVKITSKTSDGYKETIVFSYGDKPQENPLKCWTYCTIGQSLDFLMFTDLLGKGSSALPISVDYTRKDDGETAHYQVMTAYGLNADNTIRKEVIQVGNSMYRTLLYEYQSDLDIEIVE